MHLSEAQAEIDGKKVARMIMDFWQEFGMVYGRDTLESSLCAVGPLQAMIGLAIKNGHLKAVVETVDPREADPKGYERYMRSRMGGE